MQLVSGERPEVQLYLQKTREQRILGMSLALIAGYLDGYGLLILGTYVSFMSGNTTAAGVKGGQGNFHAALPAAVAILAFVFGSFLGNAVTHRKFQNSHRALFAVIGVMVGLVVVISPHHDYRDNIAIGVLSVAMGMLNPALSKVGAEAISLTFMTGTLSRIGGHLYSAIAREPLADAQGSQDSHLTRAWIDGSIWLGFLIGALLSGIGVARLGSWSVLPPSMALLVLAVFSRPDAPMETTR